MRLPPAKTSTPACDSPDGIPAPQSLYSIANSLRSVLSTVNILNAVSSSRHTSRVTLDRLADSFPGTGTSLRSCTDCSFGIALVEHQVYPRCRLAFLSHLSCFHRRLRADSAQLRQCFITCPASLRPLPRDRNFSFLATYTLLPWLLLRQTWWASTIGWARRSVKGLLVSFLRAPIFSTTSRWRSNSYVPISTYPLHCASY